MEDPTPSELIVIEQRSPIAETSIVLALYDPRIVKQLTADRTLVGFLGKIINKVSPIESVLLGYQLVNLTGNLFEDQDYSLDNPHHAVLQLDRTDFKHYLIEKDIKPEDRILVSLVTGDSNIGTFVSSAYNPVSLERIVQLTKKLREY